MLAFNCSDVRPGHHSREGQMGLKCISRQSRVRPQNLSRPRVEELRANSCSGQYILTQQRSFQASEHRERELAVPGEVWRDPLNTHTHRIEIG